MGPENESEEQHDDANSQYDQAIDDAISSATVGDAVDEEEGDA